MSADGQLIILLQWRNEKRTNTTWLMSLQKHNLIVWCARSLIRQQRVCERRSYRPRKWQRLQIFSAIMCLFCQTSFILLKSIKHLHCEQWVANIFKEIPSAKLQKQCNNKTEREVTGTSSDSQPGLMNVAMHPPCGQVYVTFSICKPENKPGGHENALKIWKRRRHTKGTCQAARQCS